MKLLLKRFKFGDTYTAGKLYIDDKEFCYTMEDLLRPTGAMKIFGETCIPAGSYKVIIDASRRFKRDMPHILDVPNFDGIRIHWGNVAKDTEGCILLGKTWYSRMPHFVGQSIKAFGEFFPILQNALKQGEVVLEIVNCIE